MGGGYKSQQVLNSRGITPIYESAPHICGKGTVVPNHNPTTKKQNRSDPHFLLLPCLNHRLVDASYSFVWTATRPSKHLKGPTGNLMPPHENKTFPGNRKPRPTAFRTSRQPQRSPNSSQNSGATNPQARVTHYTTLALNAAAGGDHVQSERYYQHAEHYIKVMKGVSD